MLSGLDDGADAPSRLSQQAASALGYSVKGSTGKLYRKDVRRELLRDTSQKPSRPAAVQAAALKQKAAGKYSSNFFGDVSVKGFRGNVSPVINKEVRGNVSPDFIVSAKGDISHNNTSRASTPASTKLRPVSADDCVERPTGDTHGPGKWRGQWFPWCK